VKYPSSTPWAAPDALRTPLRPPCLPPGPMYFVAHEESVQKIPRLKSSESVPSSGVNRRDFIKTTSLATGVLAFGVPTLWRGQYLNSKLNIASIGAMGGHSELGELECLLPESLSSLADRWPGLGKILRVHDRPK
jgi:hypothetical protein